MSAEDGDVEEKMVVSLSAKEIKNLAKPEFAKTPEKFYPTKTLTNLGFSRTQCPECKSNFWRHTPKLVTCGDSQCAKTYSFIGKGTGIGKILAKQGKTFSYADAWKSFERSLTSARVPCTAIPRYPVVARWRADVDFVAAGIFCFQPYCVTGELEPPANPLICPQFCLRFNDLDNIGLTGRHYSGFIMLGIQVFNTPGNYKFWADECVEFNYRWLTEELKIDPDEITFIEDVWAGGGNLGPSIEYFVSGLELGNMVFMQFKTYPDGTREPLQVQVIDVGIGLERVPWLINGSATSYMDVFPSALNYLLGKTGLNISAGIWDKYGPYSCLLNVDEAEDIEKTWAWIAEQIGMPTADVKRAIEPIRDIYVILDHTRTVLMAVEDGSLPSNVGGASNIRNILRRTFALLQKQGWWEKIEMVGFLEIFEHHKRDLATIYGEFPTYKSFPDIMALEYNRWKFTDQAQNEKLQKLLKKKNGVLDVQDWITAVCAWGLPADTVSQVTKLPIPGNLWYEVALGQEKLVKAQPAVLYNTAHLKETVSLYYRDHLQYEFNGKILEVMPNVQKNLELSIVILDQSSFYPTSGGQEHDTGTLTIQGKTYEVEDVMKVGPCVLHVISPPLNGNPASFVGVQVQGEVNAERRAQLRNNHTATHIVYSSCRKVLGPHVWQHGAKKTTKQAHLDITHYQSLTFDDVIAIENEANRVVHRCREITKGFMAKDVAEKEYGFHLYQGGVVPGNELRVVNIMDTDTEACCGTHCDNTAEVGTIKILKTTRISDGILRLYFVAGENALKQQSEDARIMSKLLDGWGITKPEVEATAARFFDGYKKFAATVDKQTVKILELQLRCHLMSPDSKLLLIRSDLENPTCFISNLPNFAEDLKKSGKGVVAVGDTFVYGVLGDPKAFEAKSLEPVLGQLEKAAVQKAEDEAKSNESKGDGGDGGPPAVKAVKKAALKVAGDLTVKPDKTKDKKAKPTKVSGLSVFQCFTIPTGSQNAVVDFFLSKGFNEA